MRGTVGATLTPQVACDFGCAFAAMLGAGKKVVLARDTRMSTAGEHAATPCKHAGKALGSGSDAAPAGVAELADARDSKSRGAYPPCGFDSHPRQ